MDQPECYPSSPRILVVFGLGPRIPEFGLLHPPRIPWEEKWGTLMYVESIMVSRVGWETLVAGGQWEEVDLECGGGYGNGIEEGINDDAG